jgi:hypothetical protein
VRVDLDPSWAVYQELGPLAGHVYQPVGDTNGTVFVRYGPDATLPAYLAGLATGYPPPALVEDQRWDLHGLPARRVRLVQDRGGAPMSSGASAPAHRPLPAGRFVYVAVGCEALRVPFLAGYEVPEAALEEVGTALDAIIASVRPDAPDSPTNH